VETKRQGGSRLLRLAKSLGYTERRRAGRGSKIQMQHAGTGALIMIPLQVPNTKTQMGNYEALVRRGARKAR
jgi:hypothetical protein